MQRKRVGKEIRGAKSMHGYQLILSLFSTFGMDLGLHIICKVYLNEPEICLIRQRQLQFQTDT